MMIALIVVLVFIVIDLYRHRRGLIQVSPRSLTDLKASLDAEPPASAPQVQPG